MERLTIQEIDRLTSEDRTTYLRWLMKKVMEEDKKEVPSVAQNSYTPTGSATYYICGRCGKSVSTMSAGHICA